MILWVKASGKDDTILSMDQSTSQYQFNGAGWGEGYKINDTEVKASVSLLYYLQTPQIFKTLTSCGGPKPNNTNLYKQLSLAATLLPQEGRELPRGLNSYSQNFKAYV